MRVLQLGLGPIGLECARAILERPDRLSLVAVVDVDPAKSGKDVGELLGGRSRVGVVVSTDLERAVRQSGPHVVVHTAGSRLQAIRGDIETCLRANVHVVSSSEELLYPFERHPGPAREIDALARAQGAVVLGTGVNPGFVMDSLALMATGVCLDVRSLRIERVVDASLRRRPLQEKVGAGLAVEQFAERKRAGTIGHVGIRESLLFVAGGLGWRLDRIEEDLQPILAETAITTPWLEVRSGQVAGVHHTARGWIGGRQLLDLDLKMYVGAREPHDAVRVDGEPPIDLVIRGGVFGDTATVGALVNAIPRVMGAEPGLRTMMDLPLPRALGGGQD